jgi:hypothetical protein
MNDEGKRLFDENGLERVDIYGIVERPRPHDPITRVPYSLVTQLELSANLSRVVNPREIYQL